MDIPRCATCKHWGNYHLLGHVVAMDQESREKASANDMELRCDMLRAEHKIKVSIDQGQGWDAGGASLDDVETAPDFGCVLHEAI